MTAEFDIAICGAGPVGLTLTLLLVKRGVPASRIALIDAKPLDHVTNDPRSIALSYGTTQILEEVDVWPVAADPIHEIHVSRRGHFGRTLIHHTDYALPALGYVSRYGTLVHALAAKASQASVVHIRPKQIVATDERDDAVDLQLADGTTVTAHIAVQAEGGVFSTQSTKSLHRDYQQTALVAHVTTSAKLPHRAFERFTEEGPLALLPQDQGYALVWCVRPATAARLSTLSDAAFLLELERAFGTRVGRFIAVSQRATYPLGLNAKLACSTRTVAIGNAAQTLHPVAGQGLNLGMRDAVVLARLLAQDISPAMLDRFILQRQNDRSLTIHLTDLMARLFASAPDGAISQTLLGFSLGLVDTLKPLKHILAQQMMFGLR